MKVYLLWAEPAFDEPSMLLGIYRNYQDAHEARAACITAFYTVRVEPWEML